MAIIITELKDFIKLINYYITILNFLSLLTCLVRENTERPETVEANANILVGSDKKKLLIAAQKILSKKNNWPNPFGNGTAGKQIVDILT